MDEVVGRVAAATLKTRQQSPPPSPSQPRGRQVARERGRPAARASGVGGGFEFSGRRRSPFERGIHAR